MDKKICSRCVMDESDADIYFDEAGVCNHCHDYEKALSARVVLGEERDKELARVVETIKKKGKNSDYDCIIGISGGVDSTYLAYLAKKHWGLRCLAIHFDNGWNTELAVHNIERALKTLDMDLYTYVINWNEFKDLQLNFLKASTPDSEIPTDHAIFALMMQMANKHNIKYILTGMNYATEASAVKSWSYGHSDWKYIRSVHKLMGGKKLKSFPYFSIWSLFYNFIVKRVKFVAPLNYVSYERDEAKATIENELQWRDYGSKHHESIFTRFLQSYILPNKFGIDKRRLHYSNMIHSGAITRDEALSKLQKSDYPLEKMQEDKDFVIKKLSLGESGLEEIMEAKPKLYKDYPNNSSLIAFLKKIQLFLRKYNVIHK